MEIQGSDDGMLGEGREDVCMGGGREEGGSPGVPVEGRQDGVKESSKVTREGDRKAEGSGDELGLVTLPRAEERNGKVKLSKEQGSTNRNAAFKIRPGKPTMIGAGQERPVRQTTVPKAGIGGLKERKRIGRLPAINTIKTYGTGETRNADRTKLGLKPFKNPERISGSRDGARKTSLFIEKVTKDAQNQATDAKTTDYDDNEVTFPNEQFEQRVIELIKELLPKSPPEAILSNLEPKSLVSQPVTPEAQTKTINLLELVKPKLTPVKVQTFFSRGEFKLFKYLFHLGEWKRVQKETHAQYLHYPRERETDWDKARQTVVSNIPGVEQFCKKREHTWYANRMKQLHPDLNWFYPDTFILPEEQQQYIEAHTTEKEDVYIAKMSGSRQGVGVRVLARPNELSLLCGPQQKGFTTAVVQKYINEPLLLKGIKSDLRLYLVITSIDPPIAFLNREGLARFCTEPYVKPNSLNSNKLEPSSQLTNFTMNKGNKHFQFTDEIEEINDGTKRTLTSYWKSVKEETKIEQDLIWARIEKLVQRLLKTMIPHLRLSLSQLQMTPSASGGETGSLKLMHILGLDVILDSEGNPWLLELNSMPSMAIESSEQLDDIKPDPAILKPPKPIPKLPSGKAKNPLIKPPKPNSITRSKTLNPIHKLTPDRMNQDNKQRDKDKKTLNNKCCLVDVFVKTQ